MIQLFFLILRYKYRKIKQNLRLTTCIPMNYYYMLSNIYHVNWIQIQKIHKYLCWLHQVWYFSRFFSRKEQRTRLWAPLPLLYPWQRCRIYWSPSGMLSGFVQLDKNKITEKILKWSNDSMNYIVCTIIMQDSNLILFLCWWVCNNFSKK